MRVAQLVRAIDKVRILGIREKCKKNFCGAALDCLAELNELGRAVCEKCKDFCIAAPGYFFEL